MFYFNDVLFGNQTFPKIHISDTTDVWIVGEMKIIIFIDFFE